MVAVLINLGLTLICSTSMTGDDRTRTPVPVRHNIQTSVPTSGHIDVEPTDGRPEPGWSIRHHGSQPEAASRSTGGGAELGRERIGGGAVVPAWKPVVGMPWRTIVSTTVHRQVVHTVGDSPQFEDRADTATATSARRSLSWDVPVSTYRQQQQPFTSTQVNTHSLLQYSLLPVHIPHR